MFIGVETDDTERTLDMKRIGPIAARLVANPVELVAAANQKRSTEFSGGLPTGSANNPPDAQADKGGTASELNGKGRGTVKATASVRGGAEQLRGGTANAPETAYGQRMKPAVWLVASTGMPSVNRRPKASGHAAPALGRPVLVVVGGTHYTASGSF